MLTIAGGIIIGGIALAAIYCLVLIALHGGGRMIDRWARPRR